ncbi:MAG: hypothetical protein SPJ23_06235 [Eubacteriales bacterium]|nr:hypothetical protein [Eubacteriales bacterium]
MRTDKKGKKGLRAKIGSAIRVSAPPVGFALEMPGRRTVLLHGAAQLLRTGRSETVLRLKNGEYVTVTGSDLICSAYEDRSVEVLGRITAIAFGRSEPAKKGEEETTDETP